MDMRLIGAIIGGVIAGAIGGAIWAGIAYGTGYEIGWIAWIIGGMVGFGVAAGGKMGGPIAGGVAVIITIASLLGGKYAAVELTLNKEFDAGAIADEILEDMTTEQVVSYIADQVHEERTAAGETFQWPDGVDPSAATKASEYPPEIWADAQTRWKAMSPSDRATYREELQDSMRADMEAAMTMFRGEIAKEGFLQSFGLFDIVFFGLAIVTAFKIAASGTIADAEI